MNSEKKVKDCSCYLYKENADLKQYIYEISKIPLLSSKQERDLFKQYKETKNSKIREKLIESNLRLVVSISNKFIIKSSNYIVDSLDIIQYGNEGLIKAVEKFDVDLGYRFSTYATYWIKLYIEEGLSKTARTIRLPKDIIIYYDKIKKYKDKKIKLTGIIPSNLEIAKELGLKECHIKHIIDTINMQPVSIYDIAKGQKDITLLEFIPSEDDPMEEIIIQHNSIKKINDSLKKILTDKEYKLISLRYGLVNELNEEGKKLTLEQTGKVFGVTSQQINKTENKILIKLKSKKNIFL